LEIENSKKDEAIGVRQNENLLKNASELQRGDVFEIVTGRMPFIIRWGTILFLLLICIIAFICWFVKYPDLVITSAQMNSVNAPKVVVTRTDGRIHKIKVTDNDSVIVGQLLGSMESLADLSAVLRVRNQLDSISTLVNKNRTNEILNFFPDYTSQRFLMELGELQIPFQQFVQSFNLFKDYIHDGFYLRKKSMLIIDRNNIKRQHEILQNQQKLLIQDVLLTNENFNANERLAKEKVISQMDFRNEKSKLIAKQLSLPQINNAIIENESESNEKRKELADLENQIVTQKNNFNQALYTFISQINAWEYKYLLKSPVGGRVSLVRFYQENQEVKIGESIFYVTPSNTNYFGEMVIPQYNFGKVKVGQQVLLKFHAYPYEQFGSVIGKIEYISSISTDSGFLAKVILPNGLRTTYNKELFYQKGLNAEANIITENMNLLQRLFFYLGRQFKR
jgi:multidrug resistance efflux pump